MSKCQYASIVSRPYQEVTYIAWLDGRADCLVVDPGLEPDLILNLLDDRRLTPAAIMITHGHCDHIAGNDAMKQRWADCPIVVGAGDASKLTDAELNLSAQFGFPTTSPPADVLVREGEIYSAAGFDLLVHEIPGHSSGHVVYVWQHGTPPVVFGGDVLFAGSVGRTDAMVDGDFEKLAAGIRTHLYSLPDETLLLPGHGPATTIGAEKRDNPFVPGAET